MNDSAQQVAGDISSLGAGSDAIYGMAVLGKTFLSLAFIVLLILGLSYLLKRLNRGSQGNSQFMRTVASTALGPRERVVIVEVDDTWLVLGVGGGQITKLHELPRPDSVQKTAGSPQDDQFASRLIKALAKGGKPPAPER